MVFEAVTEQNLLVVRKSPEFSKQYPVIQTGLAVAS